MKCKLKSKPTPAQIKAALLRDVAEVQQRATARRLDHGDIDNAIDLYKRGRRLARKDLRPNLTLRIVAHGGSVAMSYNKSGAPGDTTWVIIEEQHDKTDVYVSRGHANRTPGGSDDCLKAWLLPSGKKPHKSYRVD